MVVVLATHEKIVGDALAPFIAALHFSPQLSVAENFAEAQGRMAAANVRLSIIEWRLPGLNGLGGLRELAQRHPAIPIVMLIDRENPQLTMDGFAAGAAAIVPKTLNGMALTAALQLVVSGVRFAPGASMMAARVEAGGQLAILSPREREVIMLLREGLPNKLIARRLGLTEITVKSHLGSCFRKLGVTNRVQAARLPGLLCEDTVG